MTDLSELDDSKLSAEDPLDTDTCKRCGNLCDPYNRPALQCQGGCSRKIHIECLKRGSVPASFVGDTFFELNCVECNPLGEETVIRDKMPWLNVIVLTLYNLREKSSGISKRGYFHWKSDISMFVDRNWDYLFKKTVKRKKNWIGTISGTLSHYSGIFFKSGTNELGESGWWKLMDNDPPEVLIAKNCKMILERRKQGCSKVLNKSYNSPTPSESSVSVGEDSNCGMEQTKIQGPSMYSQAYVQPTEVLSNLLMEEDELNDIDMLDIEDSIGLYEQHETVFSDLMKDFQEQNEGSHFSSLLDNFTAEWADGMDISSEINETKEETLKEEAQSEEDSRDSYSSLQEQPVVSLFQSTTRHEWPWKKTVTTDAGVPRMTHQEEAYLLQQVDKDTLNSSSPAVRRLYRKLAVRKLKGEYGLPILDIDYFGFKTGGALQQGFKKSNRVLDRFVSDGLASNFEQRLQGYNEATSVHSPYTNRLLKPFIRRDTSCRPLWLKVMQELSEKVNKKMNKDWQPPTPAPIDYSYVRPQHIPAINSLCSQFFWPGIDLTECLQYPDFSCVVLYKKLVLGFAILVPDVGYNEAYISFFLTRPEWRKSGIGTFMLYHLIQTCMGKDVTLHVSATNPALILYQKFGFKIEEFIQDFYDKYMPPSSRECKHALFLRLSR